MRRIEADEALVHLRARGLVRFPGVDAPRWSPGIP